jgi:hypothetical protein
MAKIRSAMPLSRRPSPLEAELQYLIEAAEIFQAGGEDDEAHHDLYSRHPAAAARHAFEVGREHGEEEEREGEAGGEGDHADQRPSLASGHGGGQQGTHEGPYASEGRQGEGQSHEEAADESTLIRGLIQAGEDDRRDGDFEGPKQA